MRLLDREISKYKEILFVDGYNVINSWDELKMNTEEELEESRLKLINILDEYQHYTKNCIVLVFDSYNIKSDRQVLKHNNLMIVYTKELETADNFIERSVDIYASRKRIKVATSDKLEQEIILAMGATRISAKELEVEIINAKQATERIARRNKIKNEMQMSGLHDEALSVLAEYKDKFHKKQ